MCGDAAMTKGERFEFSKEVWLSFIRHRGSAQPTMSSNEWDLIRRWMDADVPLRVVLQAIHQNKVTPRTLLYFEKPVAQELERIRRAVA